MRQRIPWTKYLIPWLALGLFTSYIFYLPRNYIWVVVILARIHRRTPMDGVRAAEGGG